MRRYFAPFILRDSIKAVVIAAFVGFFILSIISIQHIELGLGEAAPCCVNQLASTDVTRT